MMFVALSSAFVAPSSTVYALTQLQDTLLKIDRLEVDRHVLQSAASTSAASAHCHRMATTRPGSPSSKGYVIMTFSFFHVQETRSIT